jgi:predicted glycosyltransferase
MCDEKEEKDMSTTEERLKNINEKIDSKIDHFWVQAEKNLLKLEEDFKKRQEAKGKTDSSK